MEAPAGHTSKVKNNVFCFNLDAKSIPEALATTILILLKFSIVLAHRQNPGASAPPRALGDASSAPLGTPGYPPVPMGPRGGRVYAPQFRNPNNNPIIVSILRRGAEFGTEVEGVQAIPPTAEFFNKKSPTSKSMFKGGLITQL